MNKKIAQFGTFEVENFGDLLFPIILEQELALRLPSFQLQLLSPLAKKGEITPIFQNDGNATPYLADAVVIGGGDIISFSLEIAQRYTRNWQHSIGPHAACWTIPSIHNPPHAPILWNAPGVPFAFTKEQAPLVRFITDQASYLSVRDELSKHHLREAGVTKEITVVPDTVLLLSKHWTKESLKPLAEKLLRPFHLNPGEPLVFQMQPGMDASIPEITKTLFSISEKLQRRILLLPIGHCHGDQHFLSNICKESEGSFVLFNEKIDCKSIAALIAHAGCFVGSSLHGNITAFAYGIPHLIYNFSRLKKLEGFSNLIQEPERLFFDHKQIIEKKELLITPPSFSTYRSLTEKIETHFDLLARHAAMPHSKELNLNSRALESYLYLLHEHQKLDRQLKEYRRCFLLDEFVFCKRFIQRFKRLAYPLQSQRFLPVRLSLLICKLFLKYSRRVFKGIFKYLYLFLENDQMKIIPLKDWLRAIQTKETEKTIRRRIQENLLLFRNKPLISCLLPITQANKVYLQELIDTILHQYYPHFELCIISYGPSDPQIAALLNEYQRKDARIVASCKNESERSSALRELLGLAKGEYVAILNQNDSLSQDALYEMIRKIQLHPEADLIYSDEDTITHQGLFTNPFYKPDWCPDSFLSRNYIRHLTLIRKELILRAGNFRDGFAKNCDYDLLLRATELTQNIFHVPKILYHRRENPNPSKEIAEEDLRALTEAVQRRNTNAWVESNSHCIGCYTVRYRPNPSAKVSVIIPTKDQTPILKKCIDSLYSRTEYSNFELIVVSNNSTDKNLFALMEEYKKTHGNSFIFYERNIPFNYAQLMNEAASLANGNYLLFLNNDTEVISGDWIREMAGQAERPTTGAVGCKLLYPNNTVQHAGVILGQKKYLGIHTFVGEERNAPGYFSWLNTINNYSALTAACLMCRKSVFNEVNGFDEELKIDCNDLDFCLKLKELGYYNVYLPHVELYHHESLTRGSTIENKVFSEQFLKIEKIIHARWAKYFEHDPCYSIHLSERGDFRSLI